MAEAPRARLDSAGCLEERVGPAGLSCETVRRAAR
jgi:hypothetical protein